MEKGFKLLGEGMETMLEVSHKLQELGIKIEIDANKKGIDIKLRKWK